MFLRIFGQFLRPSSYCLNYYSFVKFGPNYQRPLFTILEKGQPNNIFINKWLTLRVTNIFPNIYSDNNYNKKILIERENIWTVPNILCISRIAITPYIGLLIINTDFSQAFIITLFAGITDLIDGFIARNCYNQSSKLGSFLDPMADKILITTMFLTMAYSNLIPLSLTCLIVGRDLLLAGAGIYIRYKSLPSPKTFTKYFDASLATVQFSPTIISKFNTALQLTTALFTLTASTFNIIDHSLLILLWYLTGITTITSAASYIISKNTYVILRRPNRKN